MMIQAQRCGAVCHPELCKLSSSGHSKPQSGEMPAPWFVQLFLCQRGITWDRGGLKFLWILLNLCREMINCSKPINSLRTRFFQLQVYWVSGVDSRCIPLWVVRCVSSTEQPDNSPGLQEHTKLAGKRLQLAAGVNNPPYAPVGDPTHCCNIHHKKKLLNSFYCGTTNFGGIYNFSSLTYWPKDWAV